MAFAFGNICAMQVSTSLPRARSLEALAAHLDPSWLELGRFVTARRLQSSVYRGVGELTPAQSQALVTLADGGLMMGELAGRLGVAESTATRLVDRLQKARLAERIASDADRRCVVAQLTAAGRKLARELEASRRQYLAEILATLPADERRELVRLFEKVAGALRDRDASQESRS